jgi:hypothetical protein
MVEARDAWAIIIAAESRLQTRVKRSAGRLPFKRAASQREGFPSTCGSATGSFRGGRVAFSTLSG